MEFVGVLNNFQLYWARVQKQVKENVRPYDSYCFPLWNYCLKDLKWYRKNVWLCINRSFFMQSPSKLYACAAHLASFFK